MVSQEKQASFNFLLYSYTFCCRNDEKNGRTTCLKSCGSIKILYPDIPPGESSPSYEFTSVRVTVMLKQTSFPYFISSVSLMALTCLYSNASTHLSLFYQVTVVFAKSVDLLN